MTPLETIADGGRRQVPGSLPFVPPVAGMIAAGVVIRSLCGVEL
jgi:tRNA A37 threonylcarbamoyladenosine dehydratase